MPLAAHHWENLMHARNTSLRRPFASTRCGRHQRGRASGLTAVIALAAVALTVYYVGSDLSFEHSLHEPVAGTASAPAATAAATATAGIAPRA
jgi:hypothetical protein